MLNFDFSPEDKIFFCQRKHFLDKAMTGKCNFIFKNSNQEKNILYFKIEKTYDEQTQLNVLHSCKVSDNPSSEDFNQVNLGT